jgi:hypothetical protein
MKVVILAGGSGLSVNLLIKYITSNKCKFNEILNLTISF